MLTLVTIARGKVLVKTVGVSSPLTRRWWILAVIAVVLTVVLLMPGQNSPIQGSTCDKSPTGYGAWWTWMKKENTPVKRWQKPLTELGTLPNPAALLHVDSSGENNAVYNLTNIGEVREWLKAGNRLVYLGIRAPISDAPFQQVLPTEVGTVKIQGRRRGRYPGSSLLSDDYGSVVWRIPVGKGELIYSSMPWLAANAFQDQPGNFRFLQQLTTADGHDCWVDEYSHGFRGPDDATNGTGSPESDEDGVRQIGSVWKFFQQPPLFALFVQLIFMAALIAWWGNQAFGKRRSPALETPNNNQSYIEALAQVLVKANQPEFVVQKIAQAEAPRLARQLSLPTSALPGISPQSQLPASSPYPQSALTPTQKRLISFCVPKTRPKTVQGLQQWLQQWQQLRQEIES